MPPLLIVCAEGAWPVVAGGGTALAAMGAAGAAAVATAGCGTELGEKVNEEAGPAATVEDPSATGLCVAALLI